MVKMRAKVLGFGANGTASHADGWASHADGRASHANERASRAKNRVIAAILAGRRHRRRGPQTPARSR